MISATFIFKPGSYDEAFYELDERIAVWAQATDGYLGEESWTGSDGRIANVYYWRDETGLEQLMSHPDHLAAKRHQASWLSGYQVIVQQVLRSYGDGVLGPHPTMEQTQ
ncbi:antibiotic biosynthesis monooxygenase family protein [Chitinibacteraceae bacterium HSL-7]